MTTATKAPPASPDGVAKLLRHYGSGPVAFTGGDDALYERRLVFDHVVDPEQASRGPSSRRSLAIRDVLAQRWVRPPNITTGRT